MLSRRKFLQGLATAAAFVLPTWMLAKPRTTLEFIDRCLFVSDEDAFHQLPLDICKGDDVLFLEGRYEGAKIRSSGAIDNLRLNINFSAFNLWLEFEILTPEKQIHFSHGQDVDSRPIQPPWAKNFDVLEWYYSGPPWLHIHKPLKLKLVNSVNVNLEGDPDYDTRRSTLRNVDFFGYERKPLKIHEYKQT